MSLIVAKTFDDALQRIYASLRLRGYCEVFIDDKAHGFDCALKVKPADESNGAFARYWRRLNTLKPFDVAVTPWSPWRMRDFWLLNANTYPLQSLEMIEKFWNEKARVRLG